MELLQPLKIERQSLLQFKKLNELWEFAYNHVYKYREKEITTYWNNVLKHSETNFISEETFLLEYIFSVYSAGFKAAHVSAKFQDLTITHGIYKLNSDTFKWVFVPSSESEFTDAALMVIAHKHKMEAIQSTRAMIKELGYDKFHEVYLKNKDPLDLSKLPFLGPALSCHVARNLGNTKVVKPDIHLIRLAQNLGYEDKVSGPQKLCEEINSTPPAFNDLVLWLTSADHKTL